MEWPTGEVTEFDPILRVRGSSLAEPGSSKPGSSARRSSTRVSRTGCWASATGRGPVALYGVIFHHQLTQSLSKYRCVFQALCEESIGG